MSSRSALAAVLLFCIASSAAADALWNLEGFVRDSSRSDDPVILEFLKNGDFNAQCGIVACIGKRNEPFAGRFIAWLREERCGLGVERREHLLRLLLEGLFTPSVGAEALHERFAANLDDLRALFDGMRRMRDPQLRGTLLRLLSSLPADECVLRLADAGACLVEDLRARGGRLPETQTALLLDFLSTAESVPSADLLAHCVEILRLARDSIVRERAVKVVSLILDSRT